MSFRLEKLINNQNRNIPQKKCPKVGGWLLIIAAVSLTEKSKCLIPAVDEIVLAQVIESKKNHAEPENQIINTSKNTVMTQIGLALCMYLLITLF